MTSSLEILLIEYPTAMMERRNSTDVTPTTIQRPTYRNWYMVLLNPGIRVLLSAILSVRNTRPTMTSESKKNRYSILTMDTAKEAMVCFFVVGIKCFRP